MGWTCCGCRKQRPPKNFEQQYIDSTMMSATDSSLPRTMTPIGTTGEFGQLFTVYEKNWHCKDCGQENYASRCHFSFLSLLLFKAFNTYAFWQSSLFPMQAAKA